MRFLVLLLVSAALSQAGLLEMSVSGPEAPVPGVTMVRPSSKPEPVCGPADLSQMPGWPVSVASGLFSPARGVLMGRQLAADGSRQELRDAIGRRVFELRAGANDVSGLASGVYFVRVEGRGAKDVSRMRKIVIGR